LFNDPRTHERVGINKNKYFTARVQRARVPRRGDVPMFHADDFGVIFAGDLGRGVGRSIVDDNHFIRLANLARRTMDRGNAPPDPSLFIMRGNNKRNHKRASRVSGGRCYCGEP
jgi:hypothetical protein